MSRTVIKSPRAQRDLIHCFVSIGQASGPAAARRFLNEAEKTFELLARTPGIGAPFETDHPRLNGVRCASVSRFNKFLVFYKEIEGGIDIVRIIHGARDVQSILEAEEG